mgnify:FL=1
MHESMTDALIECVKACGAKCWRWGSSCSGRWTGWTASSGQG